MRNAILLFCCIAVTACGSAPLGVGAHCYPVFPRADQIRLDGRLDETAWKKAPVATGFRRLGQETNYALERQSSFRVLYDDEALYVGVRTSEPKVEEIKLTFADGGTLWGDDSFELFFFPDTLPSYHQFVCTARGSRWRSYRPEGPAKDPSGWTVAPRKGKNFYVLEIRIPFKLLRTRPTPGSKWRANVCRNCRVGKTRILSTWSPLLGGFHDIANFGTFEFKGKSISAAEAREISRRINAEFRKVVDGMFARVESRLDEYLADLKEASAEAEFAAAAKELVGEWERLRSAARERDVLALAKVESLTDRSDAVRYRYLMKKLFE